MYIFESYYKAYSTFVLDGDKRVPVKFVDGRLIVYDERIGRMIIDQKLGKNPNPYIKFVAHLPEGEEEDGGKKGGEKRVNKTETKKKNNDTAKTKRKTVSKSQKSK